MNWGSQLNAASAPAPDRRLGGGVALPLAESARVPRPGRRSVPHGRTGLRGRLSLRGAVLRARAHRPIDADAPVHEANGGLGTNQRPSFVERLAPLRRRDDGRESTSPTPAPSGLNPPRVSQYAGFERFFPHSPDDSSRCYAADSASSLARCVIALQVRTVISTSRRSN